MLSIISRIFLFVIFIIPFLYFNLSHKNLLNLLLFILGIITFKVFISNYYKKEFKQPYNWSIVTGYSFSGFYFFIAISLLYSEIKFYNNINSNLSILILCATCILLLFSLVLLYLSIKSQKYERDVLNHKENKKIIWFFFFFLILTIFYILLKIFILK